LKEPCIETCIETFTGVLFDFLNPKPEMVRIEDIAHALSQLPRYTGHCKFPYPVAQHLRVGSYFVPEEFAYDYFCHDFSEAYLNDMSRPLKHFTKAGEEYRKIERRVQGVIADVLGFSKVEPPIVKVYDTRMLYTEKMQLMPSRVFRHEWAHIPEASISLPVTLQYADFWEQKELFFRRYHELKEKKCQLQTA